MTRYDWPAYGRGAGREVRRGQARLRRRHNESLNTGFDTDAIVEARAHRHSADDDPAAAEAAGAAALSASAVGAPGGEELLAAAAPPPSGPGADRDLWLPLGPAGTLRGQADSDPRVAGRVRDLKVSPDGQRGYAVSAMGGVWYTDTAGARWEPVGSWAMVAGPANLQVASHTLTGGALHVRFHAGGDPAQDEVWIGTGEPGQAGFNPFDIGIGGGQYAGVGVLHAVGPVATGRATPLVDPWTRQAQPRAAAPPQPAYAGLSGAAVYTIAADPADDRHLVAATTRGLHERAGANPDPWSQVTVAAWEALQAGVSGTALVTDVAWTPATGAHPVRLWATVVSPVAGLTGLWVSTAGTAGPFTPVALPGLGATRRLGLASDPVFPDVLYVLGSGPRLWRVDDVTAAVVTPVPPQLFQPPGGNDQSDYDLALAVDPGNANRVLVAGSTAQSPHDQSWAASLYRLTLGALAVVAGVPTYPTDYAGGNAADPTWVGAEVHADVHRVRWQAVGAASHVWVCCDGGVFRSVRAGDEGSFVSRATGMAVTEPGYVALHPLSDGPVLAGVQDNGAQLRIGESVWRRTLAQGDSGGVAFDPGAPGRFVAQANGASWNDDGGGWITPGFRGGTGAAAFTTENRGSRFYCAPAVVRRGDGVTQIAVGSTRVWYSERWGRSRWDGAVWRRFWDTLPAAIGVASAVVDPRAGDANDAATNDFSPNSGPASRPLDWIQGVHALKWAGPDRLYVLQRGAVHRLDRNPPTNGQWTLTAVHTRAAPPVVAVAPPWPVAGAALPAVGALNDFAVHNAGAGPHGALYVATSHPLEPLWWFDGTATWHPCRLGTPVPPAPPVPAVVPVPAGGVRAPAYAVVVDPDDARVVYVGTTVGVWRGVLTLPGPTWAWTAFNSGLPEAAVQDLAIGVWPRPPAAPLKLLRVALQARGVWEVEPGVDAAPATYLRVQAYDSRRVTPSPTVDPMWNLPTPERDWPLDWADRRNRDHRDGAGRPRAAPDGTPVGQYPWHASPDVRLRPAPRVAADPAVPVPPTLPWTTVPRDRFQLWSLQTALRTIDPLVVPDGRWTAWWRARLRGVRVTLGIDAAPGQARVSAALWNHAQVQAAFWADPWSDGGPTETDLVERVVGQPTPRVGGPAARASSPASAAVMRSRYRVDVCVHHRGREPLAAAQVAVVLLRLQLPAAVGTWAGLGPVVLPAGPALAALHAALDALPAAGGALPGGLGLPAGWAVGDVGVAVRRPDRPVATGAPAVVTFDADFSAAARRSRWLLVALVHSTADPVALTGADLRGMVLGSRHVGARSVEVV